MESFESAPRAIGLKLGRVSALLIAVIGRSAARVALDTDNRSARFKLTAKCHPQLH